MKAFQITGDENRIYFENLTRRPVSEELSEVLQILKHRGCNIGKEQDLVLLYSYECKLGNLEFDLLCSDEEAFIYTDDTSSIDKIIKLFD
ncbi:MAG: hypothetical protein ACI4EF_06100 [Coprococcus sp.]